MKTKWNEMKSNQRTLRARGLFNSSGVPTRSSVVSIVMIVSCSYCLCCCL